MVNIEKRREALLNAIDAIVSDPYMIAIRILGDNKYYITKTTYRLEIRDDDSRVWHTYVMLPPGGSDDTYKKFLVDKYLDLVANSNPDRFDDEEEN